MLFKELFIYTCFFFLFVFTLFNFVFSLFYHNFYLSIAIFLLSSSSFFLTRIFFLVGHNRPKTFQRWLSEGPTNTIARMSICILKLIDKRHGQQAGFGPQLGLHLRTSTLWISLQVNAAATAYWLTLERSKTCQYFTMFILRSKYFHFIISFPTHEFNERLLYFPLSWWSHFYIRTGHLILAIGM